MSGVKSFRESAQKYDEKMDGFPSPIQLTNDKKKKTKYNVQLQFDELERLRQFESEKFITHMTLQRQTYVAKMISMDKEFRNFVSPSQSAFTMGQGVVSSLPVLVRKIPDLEIEETFVALKKKKRKVDAVSSTNIIPSNVPPNNNEADEFMESSNLNVEVEKQDDVNKIASTNVLMDPIEFLRTKVRFD